VKEEGYERLMERRRGSVRRRRRRRRRRGRTRTRRRWGRNKQI
jgi:hypothetical protein